MPISSGAAIPDDYQAGMTKMIGVSGDFRYFGGISWGNSGNFGHFS